MATATITVTTEELEAILGLANTDKVDFDLAEVEAGAIDTAVQAYVDLELSKNNNFEPFGRKLRRFANEQIPVLRDAVEEVDPG